MTFFALFAVNGGQALLATLKPRKSRRFQRMHVLLRKIFEESALMIGRMGYFTDSGLL